MEIKVCKVSRIFPIAISVLALSALSGEARANLIQESSFENPLLGSGGYLVGYQVFQVGSSFGVGNAWTVVGSTAGDVAVYPGSESYGTPATALNVSSGSQALDLSGQGDTGAATGVSQVITTTPNSTYSLSFSLGEMNNQAASVLVYVNGILFQATNNAQTTGFTTLWQQYSYSFQATSPSTTITLINNAAAGTILNAVDDIQINGVATTESTATPEPSTMFLISGSLVALAFVRRRKA